MSGTLLNHALLLSAALFAIGVVGVFVRRNVITILMCIELMLNAANLVFVTASRYWAQAPASGGLATEPLRGQVMVFFVLTVAAAEAAVGLAIIVALHRQRDTLDPDAFDLLRG
jgi:NADH-quinone oxidoreductase subunit K